MHGDGLDVVAGELAHEPVGAALGADEDERAAVVGAEVIDERLDLRVRLHGDEAVRDLARVVHGQRPGLDVRRAGGVLAGELADLAVERGREEHRLAVARDRLDDPVDLRLEAHVEHAVGLVEDEDADAAQVEQAAVDQVLEAAGRRDDDVCRARALRLSGERNAAVDDRDGEAHRPRDRAELVGHLARELARGDEDERAGAPVVLVGALDDRDRRTRASSPSRSATSRGRRAPRARPGGRGPGSGRDG